ncbi:hypothetical protein [Methylogaea oryzae]|uniref:hypothetical protein n=1 Tax=Methylogaea oryzae TaxID=1295382 RepID=UPI0012E0D7CC|nr:hypothetical protein [Methylogaea oryzae]
MPMPPLKRRTAVFLACIAALCCGGGETVAQSRETAAEPVALSFVFFGCNRLDKDGAEATDSKSTANVAQLLQSFQDIARLPRLPQYVFLAGDIVKAKKPGTDALAKQLSAWVKLATNPKKNPLIGKASPSSPSPATTNCSSTRTTATANTPSAPTRRPMPIGRNSWKAIPPITTSSPATTVPSRAAQTACWATKASVL